MFLYHEFSYSYYDLLNPSNLSFSGPRRDSAWQPYGLPAPRALGYLGPNVDIGGSICSCQHLLKSQARLYLLRQPLPRSFTGKATANIKTFILFPITLGS